MCAMMAATSLPLAIVLLLLLAASAVPAATAGGKHTGARMVIIRGHGTSRVGGGAAGGARTNEQRRRYRRLEDEVVSPEELFGGLLGAGEGGIGYGALEKGRPGCQSGSQCAGKAGGSYLRGCTYENRCPH